MKEKVCWTLYDVLFALVSCFDTQRLTAAGDLRSATSSVLSCRCVADDFFKRTDQGVYLVWKDILAEFPVNILPFVEMAQSIGCAGPDYHYKVTV